MKVLLLAGGFGTRMSEYTESIPKPMVSIGGQPILIHIMNTYAKYGHKDFYIATGYKSQIVKDYFLNFRNLNSNFTINLGNGQLDFHEVEDLDWNITIVDTGKETMTGGRIKRMRKYLSEDNFLMTYGDGVADIDINKLIDFHSEHKKMCTVTAVHPNARFGELEINENMVTSFKEKPQISKGWINGGYFVMSPKIFDFIEGDKTVLEREPLEKLSELKELMAFHHDNYWQCIDTKRDRDVLENLWNSNKAPWKI